MLANGYPGAQPAYTGTYGAYTPNYPALVKSSPIYQAWKTGSDRAILGAGDVRRQAAQQALLGFGGLPAGYQDPYGDFDAATQGQAAANPESAMARLQQGYDAAGQQLQTSLAARGALQSGDLVQGQQNLDQGFQGNVADATSAFLASLTGAGGINDQYTGKVDASLSGEPGAIAQATTALENDPTYAARPGQTVTLRPDWYGNWGKPVYQGADGSLYQLGPDGNLAPFTDPNTGQGTSPFLPASAYGDFPQGDTPGYATS